MHVPTGTDFEVAGVEGPQPLLTVDQCAAVVRHWKIVCDRPNPVWSKASAIADRVFFDLASRPAITDLVCRHLGPDIVLWGASVIGRKPSRKHPWHTDMESSVSAGFASVWIGLEGTCRESAMKLLPHSHLFGKAIQQLAAEAQLSRLQIDDAIVLGWARSLKSDAQIVQPDMRDGDGVIFDGRIWHGTENLGPRRRLALLLQYARADCPVRMPLNRQYSWPFTFCEQGPPALAVCGKTDSAANNIMAPPQPGRYSSNKIGAASSSWTLPLEGDPVGGWRRHVVARGRTPNLASMSVHASVLAPGKCPHPPHAHVEEELLIVLEGEAEILLGEGPEIDAATPHAMRPGAFAFYPTYQFHTIRNQSAAPVTYLMFKWSGPLVETSGQARTQIVHFPDVETQFERVPRKQYRTRRFFEAPTSYLRRLHAHVTRVEPDKGYKEHVDNHDVAIVVLAGEIAVNGKRAGPGGVFYLSAGVPHDMWNIGFGTASYLVFEFEAADRISITPAVARLDNSKAHARPPDKQRWAILRAADGIARWLVSPLTRKIERVVDRRIKWHLAQQKRAGSQRSRERGS